MSTDAWVAGTVGLVGVGLGGGLQIWAQRATANREDGRVEADRIHSVKEARRAERREVYLQFWRAYGLWQDADPKTREDAWGRLCDAMLETILDCSESVAEAFSNFETAVRTAQGMKSRDTAEIDAMRDRLEHEYQRLRDVMREDLGN